MNIDLKEDGSAIVVQHMRDLSGPMGERAHQAALKSCGWYLQQAIKQAGRAASYEGGWEPLSAHTKVIAKVKEVNPALRKEYVPSSKSRHYKRAPKKGLVVPSRSRTLNPLARLVNAPRYVAIPQGVEVGFVGNARSCAGLIASMASSAIIPVSPQMRRFFFGIGWPLKRTTAFLHRPARPWIRPVYLREKDNIGPRYEQKYIKKLKELGVEFE